MSENVETIELEIKDELQDGTFALSLVNRPAIESDFVALSEDSGSDSITFSAVDDDRNIVVGFALIPDIIIPRNQDGKRFNVTMSKETVAKSAELFLKNHNNSNVTTEHKKPVKDCCVIESWIVEDPKNDKSNVYNLNPKGGEWVVMMKLYNEEEYQKAKRGEYKGFSIEGMYKGMDKINQSKEEEDSDIINEILETLNNITK